MNAVIGALRVVLGMDSAAFNDGVGAAQKRMAQFRKSMQRTGRQLQRVGAGMTAGLTTPLVALAYKSAAAQKEQERAIASVTAALADTDSGRITQAWNAIGDALERIGAIILPIVADFADHVKRLAERFQDLSPETQRFVVIAGTVAAAIGPVVTALGLMLTALAPMAGVIMAIVSPLGLLAAGIAAAGTAIYANWGALKEDFPAITGAVEAGLGALQVQFKNVMEAAGVFGKGLKDHVRLTAEGVEALIKGDFAGGWQALTEIVRNANETVLGALDAFFGPLDDRLLAGAAALLVPFQTWVSDMAALLAGDPEVLGAAIGTALAAVVARVEGVRDAIAEAFRGLIDGLRRMLQGEFASVWASGVQAVQKFGADVLAALAQLLVDAVIAAKEIGTPIVAGILQGLQDTWQDLRDYVSGLAKGIASVFRDETETRSPSQVFRRLGRSLADGLILGMDEGRTEVESAASRLANAASVEELTGATRDLAKGFNTAGAAGSAAFGNLGSLLSEAIKGTRSLGDVATSVLQDISNSFRTQGIASLSTAFGGMFGGGEEFFSSLFGGLIGFARADRSTWAAPGASTARSWPSAPLPMKTCTSPNLVRGCPMATGRPGV